jgi:hypothetical protein
MQFDNVMMMIDLLTFDFKLALLFGVVLLEVQNEQSDDAR